MARPWSEDTKRLVVIGLVIAAVLLLYRFSSIIPPLALAVMVAYILHPAVGFITAHTRLSRGWAVVSVYLALLVVIGILLAIFIPLLIEQMQELDVDVHAVAENIRRLLAKTITVGNLSIDLGTIYGQVSNALQSFVSSFATRTVTFLLDLVTGFVWVVFVLVISFYLLKDAEQLSHWFCERIPADYRPEWQQLIRQIEAVWDAFFRAQIIQCLVVGVIVTALTAVVGVKNALILGVVAALMELLPSIGHTISGAVGAAFAYFQGSTFLPLSNFWFTVLVIGIYVVVSQVDTNYLLPRIVGRRVRLHPVVVIVGFILGASLAGVLGVFLAAPTISTLRVLGSYIYRRLLDLQPYVVEVMPLED